MFPPVNCKWQCKKCGYEMPGYENFDDLRSDGEVICPLCGEKMEKQPLLTKKDGPYSCSQLLRKY